MPRARLLKPGFFANEPLAALPPYARILFAGLWTLADREGRLKDIPKWIDAQIFPYDKVNTDKLLGQLAEAGFIERYTDDDGQRLIWIPTFTLHQHPHPNEPASTLSRHKDDQGNDNVMSPQLQSHEPSQPLSRVTQAVTYSTPLPSIPSESIAVANSPTGRPTVASPKGHALNFADEVWSALHALFPGENLLALWREWVLWVEEEEEKRRPKDPREAFEGFVRKKQKRRAEAAAFTK